MFERFTDRARRVVVLAQEEARMLNHNYIGTEHLLLGLIHEGEGIGARALESLGVTLNAVREQVQSIVGPSPQAPSGHITFTPRAKKVLELSMREAIQLNHGYIGTEHILLGMVRASEGVANQVLSKVGVQGAEVRQAVTARYGLDEPLGVRYWHWLTRALTGDFGDSVRSATPVTDVLASRVSLTAWLTIGAFILAVAVGIPLGIAAARRRGSWVDRTIVGWSVVGVSAPGFALGLVLLYVFGLMLGWFPVFGEGTGIVDTLWHLTLPAIALATGIGAMLVRITRAAVGAELAQDYVTFARSRGVPSRRITAMYVRGAALPIITSAGLILGTLFGSTVLVEEAFSLPGLGQLLADSITYKDVPVVQAIALLVAFVIIVVTLIVDVVAFAVDPRQTLGEGRGA